MSVIFLTTVFNVFSTMCTCIIITMFVMQIMNNNYVNVYHHKV